MVEGDVARAHDGLAQEVEAVVLVLDDLGLGLVGEVVLRVERLADEILEQEVKRCDEGEGGSDGTGYVQDSASDGTCSGHTNSSLV